MRLFLSLKVVLAAVLIPSILFAGNTKSYDEQLVSITFSDDLYVAGGKVVVSEPVAGDAMVAGGSLIVNSRIRQDLHIAGGSLFINGPVGDDIRAGGGDINLISSVGGDLVVFGGTVTITSGAVIEGDVVVCAGNLILAGTVRGNLLASAEVIDITGTVEGNATLKNADVVKLNGLIKGETVFVTKKVELRRGAGFGKDVVYWRDGGELDFGATPVGGQVRYDPELEKKAKVVPPIVGKFRFDRSRGPFGLWFLLSFLAGTVLLVPLTLLFSGTFREAGWQLSRSFWKSLGIGLLTYTVLPVAAILTMITVIGIPLGVVLIAVFIFDILFGRIIAALAIASWIERYRSGTWSKGVMLLVAICLLFVLKLMGAIPFAGWLLVVFAVIASFGAFVLACWDGRSSSA